MVDALAEEEPEIGNERIVGKYYRQAGMPTIWCAGCGNGTVVNAIVRAIDRMGLKQDDIVISTGIGCSGYLYNYLNFDGYHGTHGRALAAATGIKLANPRLQVIVPMGDGDCAAIGGNHLIHAARRNIDLTAIVINNGIYGMTGGQYSPMTPRGSMATTAPFGQLERSLDVAEVAIAAGATYVARSTTYHVRQLIDLIASGISHQGFSLIEVVSQCPVQFGRRNGQGDAVEMLCSFKERAISVKKAASLSSDELKRRIVTGVLHQVDGEPEYCEQYEQLIVQAQTKARNKDGSSVRPVNSMSQKTIDRREIRLAGIGGQGLALAGAILAEAAGMDEGRFVAHSESHAPNARGGPSLSDVIVSDDAIDFPTVVSPDVLVATTAADIQRYMPGLKPGGCLIIDSTVTDELPSTAVSVYRLPLTAIARSKLGAEVVTGIVALAAVAKVSGVVSIKALQKAVERNVPARELERNRRALEMGFRAGDIQQPRGGGKFVPGE